MRRLWAVLLILVGAVVGYFAWVSRPEPGDRAELTDSCAFPTIDNTRYRELVAEAKSLIEPKSAQIAYGDGNIEQNTRNPPLRDLALEFVKRSQSTEESFVRLFAFGRALNGRVEDVAPAGETFAGPWALWLDRDSADGKLRSPQLSMYARFQAPPGLFNYPIGTWITARLFGRRYDRFRIGIWFDIPESVAIEIALKGSYVVDAGATKAILIDPLSSIHWGDRRIENRCPNAENFLKHVDRLLKRRKN